MCQASGATIQGYILVRQETWSKQCHGEASEATAQSGCCRWASCYVLLRLMLRSQHWGCLNELKGVKANGYPRLLWLFVTVSDHQTWDRELEVWQFMIGIKRIVARKAFIDRRSNAGISFALPWSKRRELDSKSAQKLISSFSMFEVSTTSAHMLHAQFAHTSVFSALIHTVTQIRKNTYNPFAGSYAHGQLPWQFSQVSRLLSSIWMVLFGLGTP